MMAHGRKPKRSSHEEVFWRRLRSGEAFDEDGDLMQSPGLDDLMLRATYEIRKAVLVDLANLQDQSALEWFWRKWRKEFRSETPQDVINLRDELRLLWQVFDPEFPEFDYPQGFIPEEIVNRWLAWRPSPEQSEQWTAEGWTEEDTKEHFPYVPYEFSFASRKLVPDTSSLRAMMVQGILEHWGYFKHCANSDCASPYFIAKRKDQTVCDAEICKAEKQREHARKWWNENRAKKSSPKQSRAASKTKESGKNVTRKAR